MEKGKGSADAPSQLNKLAPTKKTIAPSAPPHILCPHPLLAMAGCPPPSDALEVVRDCTIAHMVTGSDMSSQYFERTSSHRLTHLATMEKCNTQKGVMDSLHDKS
jgi:hypothetical protein